MFRKEIEKVKSGLYRLPTIQMPPNINASLVEVSQAMPKGIIVQTQTFADSDSCGRRIRPAVPDYCNPPSLTQTDLQPGEATDKSLPPRRTHHALSTFQIRSEDE